MLRWLLVLVVMVAPATATAQPRPTIAATTRAWNAALAAGRRVATLGQQRAAIARRWQDELRAVDRLKNAPRSWRRDRELRDKLAEANEVAKQLETINAALAVAQRQLVAARRAVVAAIDAELAAGPSAPRRARLERARTQVAPRQPRARRIVLPDLQIDPLADPEELDQQASALRASERELAQQIQGLEAQAAELERVAMLRRQHERTREMDQRDDNSVRRSNGATGGDGRTDGAAAPETDGDGGDGAPPPGFEMDATVTLAEIIDQPTIDSLKSAQRSGDPARRAEAARRARDAVARKLQQLRARRRQVEERARSLRGE